MAKKRKYGSGTLRKRSDGRWEARVVTGYDESGNPKTKNVLAKTKAECLVKLEELKEKYAPPVAKCSPGMRFGDWLDFWYQNYCKPQLRLNTQLGYEDRIYKHIIPEIGSIPLNKMSQNDLQQFYAKLKTSGRLIRVEQYGTGLSDRMVRACHASCRSALQKAVEEGLIRINPAIGCKLPPKKSGEMNILTQEEMQRFLNALSLGKNPDAMQAFWLQLKVNEQIAKGIRLKDMPDEWFVVPDDEAMQNSMVATQGVFATNRLMDQQRFEDADRLIAHLLEIDSGIIGLHRNLMICDRMYCELIHDNRKEILEEMLTREQIKFMKAMKKFPSVVRTEYAYALLALKDTAKVNAARELFEKVAKTYPYPSDVQSERELIGIADNIAREASE